MSVVVLAGGSGSEHENWGSARLRNQFLYDSKGFSCMILYTSMHTKPVTCVVVGQVGWDKCSTTGESMW